MLQSIQRLFQILHGIGIGDSDLPGDIVRLTGHCGDQRLIQKILAQVYSVLDHLISKPLTEIGLHIRIYIERALYIRTCNPFYGIEPLHHIVFSPLELFHHNLHVMLRALQSR